MLVAVLVAAGCGDDAGDGAHPADGGTEGDGGALAGRGASGSGGVAGGAGKGGGAGAGSGAKAGSGAEAGSGGAEAGSGGAEAGSGGAEAGSGGDSGEIDGGSEPECGDGIVDDGEACDDGTNDGSYGTCNDDCTLAPHCGDGELEADEEACDDGTNDGSYGTCNADCTLAPRCGDGEVDSGVEACDDGTNDGSYGTCNADCTLAPRCGDGELETAEEDCDRGDALSDAVDSPCSTTCEYTSLVVWLDGSDPNGDGSAPLNGSSIGLWADKARGNDAVQSTATAQPVYDETGLGSGALSFDGSDDVLSVALDIGHAAHPELTVIAVFQNAAGHPSEFAGVWGQDNGGWDRFLVSGGSSGTGVSNGSGLQPVTGLNAEDVKLVAVTTLVHGGASSVHVNGALAATFTANQTGSGTAGFSVGNLEGPEYPPRASRAFDGLIAELMVFDRALSADEINQVGERLADKYELPTFCGDGAPEGGEACDDGANDGSYGTCNADCTLAPFCGDGDVDTDEECDDGTNDGSYATCNPDCTHAAFCGDGEVDSGDEECDDGTNDGSEGTCNPGCTLPVSNG